MISEKTEKALRDIGLTEYESLAYLSLLKLGEATAEIISEVSTIPYSKVYSVLEGLEMKGWVDIERGRPRRYFPRSPTDSLRAEQLRMESEFERNRDIIIQELQPMYEQKDLREMPEIWIVRGEKNVFDKMVELIQTARKEIMVVLPMVPERITDLSPTIDRIVDTNVQSILDSNICVKILTTKEVMDSIGGISTNLAEFRVRNELYGGGIVVDGRETLIFLGHEFAEEPPMDMAIWSDNEALTMISTVYFQNLWDNSELYAPKIKDLQ